MPSLSATFPGSSPVAQATMENPALTALRQMASQIRTPKLRSMLEFAEQEIVIPDGQYEGRRYSTHRQPIDRLWFNELDAGSWIRVNMTGPTQSGKTLKGYVIPTLYHLFEVGEKVLIGLPTLEMAEDKWTEDLYPAISASRYAKYLPSSGRGSRGGRITRVQFENGATLRFMSGGGRDKKRAGYTTRIVAVTETDGMDEAGGGSRETDKISQFEARSDQWGSKRKLYMECTVSIAKGRTWREYQQGSASRIVVPCPHCGQWITPEREHFVGWKADTLLAAQKAAAFVCSACGGTINDEQRSEANAVARLLHRGQSIGADGAIIGEKPETDTLGFRYNAFNNLFWTIADIAAREWRAARRAEDEEDDSLAEKEMRQFVWALPYDPPVEEMQGLEAKSLLKRVRSGSEKGTISAIGEHVVLAIDCGKYYCHWLLLEATATGQFHVPDYGTMEVPSARLGVEKALMATLREFRDTILAGWKHENRVEMRLPDEVWIDARFLTEVVKAFCRESDEMQGVRFRPLFGRGETQGRVEPYSRPRAVNDRVRYIGEGYHLERIPRERVKKIEHNSDQWKSRVHERLACPVTADGAITFYDSAEPKEHLGLVKHLLAEKQTREFVPGRGDVIRWFKVRQHNHWLDTLAYASAAAHYCGARVVETDPRRPSEGKPAPTGWFAARKKNEPHPDPMRRS